MAVFRYQGRDRKGRKTTGRIKADSRKEALVELRNKGTRVIKIDEINSILYKDLQFFEAKVKLKDFVIYIRQFSTLLKAGLSVVNSTKVLAEQTSSKTLKKALEDIAENLEEGTTFSESADKHRKVFPALFVNLIKAGETGGNLDDILDRLAIYYEKQHATRQKVKSALAYPAFVGIVSIGIVIFLLSTVVPTFASMFESFDAELPAITKFVMSLGGWFQSFWWVVVLFFIVTTVILAYIRKNKHLKYYLDILVLKSPIFGNLIQKAILARMTRTLSSLFASSVPILQAVTIVERVVNNEVIGRVLQESRNSLENGQSIATPMKKHWAFPPLVTQMIAVGEEAGALDTMLDKVADFYESEVDTATEQIKSLIEPLMIVILSVIVGGIVASIAVPMFAIFDNIGM
ncbi:type II secretion system F family protein [Bacillus tianshenii]|nr:type II secretion system F family protein [Bacillus tianshenii]